MTASDIQTPAPAASETEPRHRAAAPANKLRGDIEGLRAIAVGTVLLYHVGVTPLSGGFAGVDIFFVISGFLITSLLLREAERNGRISIPRFYARRARRLLPAASIVLIFTALVGWRVLPATRHENLATDVIGATFYGLNWVLADRSVNYLAEDAGLSPVQHYWSLSVEEQYYVFWPLLMIAGLWVARLLGVRVKRVHFVTIGAIAVASLVYSIIHTASDPATSYFITTTRVWELGIGSLLSFAVVRLRVLPRLAAEVLAWLGLVMITISVFTFSSATAWPGYAALLPTLGTAAVIAAGCATVPTHAGRLLSVRPMTWIGGLSYSIYLWHWPLLILAEAKWPDISFEQKLGLGALSVLLAWLTKVLVEDPVRFNPLLERRVGLALLTGAVVMAVSVVAAVAVQRSVPELNFKLDPNARGATALVGNPQITFNEESLKDRSAVTPPWKLRAKPAGAYTKTGKLTPDPAIAPEDSPTYYADGCQVQPGVSDLASGCSYAQSDGDKTVVMLGDSKMGQWFPGVESIASRENWRLDLYLKSGCTFSLGGVEDDCAAYARNVLDKFEKDGAPEYALVSQGKSAKPELTAGMTEALSELSDLGTKIVLVADNPTPPPDSLIYECVLEHSANYSACAFGRGDNAAGRGTAALKQVGEELDLPMIDLNDWICPPKSDRCPPAIGRILIYRQGSHVTATYVRTLTPMLHRALANLDIAKRPRGLRAIPQP